MGESSLKDWKRPKNFVASIKSEQLQLVNLTDLDFSGLCKENYGVNKGVYNTIDQYFFNQGIRNILYRRVYILEFLDEARAYKKTADNVTFIPFGAGGLSKSLHAFFLKKQK